jgi:hypothetical protein
MVLNKCLNWKCCDQLVSKTFQVRKNPTVEIVSIVCGIEGERTGLTKSRKLCGFLHADVVGVKVPS